MSREKVLFNRTNQLDEAKQAAAAALKRVKELEAELAALRKEGAE